MADEAAVSQYLFGIIDPYIRHNMRSIVEGLLSKSLHTVATFMDAKLHNGAIGLGAVLGTGTAYAAGSVLTTLGSFIPFVAPLIETVGTNTIPYAGAVAGYVSGKLASGAFIDSTATNVAKRMDHVTRTISNFVLTYTPEEHALYALNKNASQTERALFEEDYALRDRLENTYTHSAVNIVRLLVTGNMGTLLGQARDSVTEAALAPFNALCGLFTHNADLDTATALERTGLDAYRNTHENMRRMRRESAHRHLMVAKHVKSPEGQELLENLKKFPSHAYRMGTHQAAPTISQDALRLEKNFALDMEMLSWDLAANFGQSRDYDAHCARMLEMLLSLTPMQQDILLEMRSTGYPSPILENLIDSIESFTSMEKVLQATLRAIDTSAAEKNALYAQENANDLGILRDHSIAQNLTDADLVELHKKLEANPDARASWRPKQPWSLPLPLAPSGLTTTTLWAFKRV